MWVLSVDAGTLLSVVQFDPKKAPAMAKAHKADDGGDYLLVRARVKQSLQYVADVLDAIFLGEVDGWEKPVVAEDKAADYKYRMIVQRDHWKRYLIFEVDGVDYSSHVKEETVKRQPEPKIANLYSALSATWSAWSKLQDTPPYGGYGSYGAKPDCRNCGHTELRHTMKGDKCLVGWKTNWNKDAKASAYSKDPAVKDPCACTKYEPKYPACAACKHAESRHENKVLAGDKRDEHCKDCSCAKYTQVAPSPPAVKSAKDSAAVFSGTDTGVTEYPASVYGSSWDLDKDEGEGGLDWNEVQFSEYDHAYHPIWCTIFDGDLCICTDPDEIEERFATGAPAKAKVAPAQEFGQGSIVDGVFQEGPVAGETPQQKKARLARNRRARRRARKQAEAGGVA